MRLTDEVVEAAASCDAALRPPLDPVSLQAVDQDIHPERTVISPETGAATVDDVADAKATYSKSAVAAGEL